MSFTVTITVSGPGMAINTEMALVEKALRDAGIPVEVINDYPDKSLESALTAEHIEYCKKRKLKLVADHCPWGG